MNGHEKLIYSNGNKANGCNGNHNHSKNFFDQEDDTSVTVPLQKSVGNGHLSTKSETEHPERKFPVNSWYCSFTLLATTASTMMSMGLSFGAINPTMIFLTMFYSDIYEFRHNETAPKSFTEVAVAFTVSIPLFGGLLGALSLGLFLQFLTRKRSMIVINLINTMGVMLSSFVGYVSYSYELIIFGRMMMGFASGVALTMVPMVISESSTKQRAPFYLSLIGVNLSLGGLIGLTFGLNEVFGNDSLWPLLLAFPSIPSVVYLSLSPFLPETPSYLISIRKTDEAMKTLKKLRETPSSAVLNEEMASIRREQGAQGRSTPSLSLKTIVTRPGYRYQLFLVIMVFLASEFCGVNAIGIYSNMIFTNAGIAEEYVTYASLIVYFVQFLVSLAGSAAVDRWGAKRLAVFWLTIMGLSMALLTTSVHYAKDFQRVSYVSVVAVTVYILSWACGPNITLFPLVTTLTTEATREASFKLGGVIFWISSWFVGFIPNFLMDGLKEYAYVVWGIFDVVFAVFFYFYLPETRGKTPEQIQSEIHSKGRATNQNGTMQALQPI